MSLFKTSLTGGGAVTDKSTAFEFDSTDLTKTVIHCLLVGAAAALTVFGESLANVDFGVYNSLLVPVISTAIAAFQKWVKDNHNWSK